VSVPQSTDGTPAVIYAAKSTEDKRGSIPTQIADGHALAEKNGWQVVDKFNDESASAYKGNRGQGLADARALVERLVSERGDAVLIVQHTDRLARGDGVTADHLVELALWARRAGVRIASVQDPMTCEGGLAFAAMMGDRNHEDSRRKSLAVAAGKQRQFERGETLGRPADGYCVVVDPDGSRRRDFDPQREPIVSRIFDMIETGAGCGEVGRTLTAEGIRAQRGGTFNNRTVRQIVTNPYYAGWVVHNGELREGQHPRLIERERWERINASLNRMDPASVQRRAGGRRPTTPYLLRGVAFCRRCGAVMYTRNLTDGRWYICREVRQATGLCDAPRIRADLLEQKVLWHLDDFYAGFDGWARERLTARADEAQVIAAGVESLRAGLVAMERNREKHRKAFRRYVERDEHGRADLAADEVERIDAECRAQVQAIDDAEARLAEWTAAPSHDALLDFYADVREVVSGRLARAKGHDELRAALAALLEGLWVELKPGGKNFDLVALEVVLRDEHVRIDDPASAEQEFALVLAEPDTSPSSR
jgi:DNA invertase Pin-like site-specific DNA recombinase